MHSTERLPGTKIRAIVAVVMLLIGVVALRGQTGGGAVTTRVSISSTGAQANNLSGGTPSMSSDGRYVAFSGDASNLVTGDTNGASDIFVRDRQTGTTTRVSISNTGAQANSSSGGCPAISADARYVAFPSFASNLVAGDTNGTHDVFVRDRQAGTTTRVTISSAGGQANSWSDWPSVNWDGRVVAFSSHASNLVGGDTNGTDDIFVRDLQTNTTTRVSVASTGEQANGSSSFPSISADGRFVAFTSDASNLVAGDTNGTSDIFVRDRQTSTTTRVSISNTGGQVYKWSTLPSISGDGRYVAFISEAPDLVGGDTNFAEDIFVRDRQTGTTTRVSLASTGEQANRSSSWPSISADGRYVSFESLASNLVGEDTNGTYDIFVRDRQTGATTRVSLSSNGEQANDASDSLSISADGRYVAFESDASNLVAGDTNGAQDIFVRELGAEVPQPPTLTVHPSQCAGGQSVIGTVTLSAAAPNNTTFTLSSSDTGAATVPTSVTVPAGGLTATFVVNTHSVPQATDLTIHVTGPTTVSAPLRVVTGTASTVTGMLLKDGTRIVKGIVCDNFRTTLASDVNKLTIVPPAYLGTVATIYGYLCDANGVPVNDPYGSSNGTVNSTGTTLTYRPPDEFNRTQNPTDLSAVWKAPTRTVYVRATFKTVSGEWYQSGAIPIVIARPPIVLVHGINNGWSDWRPFVELMQTVSATGFPFAAVHHGQDYGRGPVELAASELATKIEYVKQRIRDGQWWMPGTVDGSGAWDNLYTAYADIGPLAIRRVDVIAHSYGGAVARWLLADRTNAIGGIQDSRTWYLRRGLTFSGTRPGVYVGQIRKLVTIGTMWRGTPLANMVNEVNADNDLSMHTGFGLAPVTGYPAPPTGNLFDLIANIGWPLNRALKDERLPAWQVMAVESPWMRYLIYGQYPNGTSYPSASNFPFRTSVGYTSIAGDDSDYTLGLNLFGKYDDWQQPSWFPYFRLEEAVGAQLNYSDGIVPVWSACIPGAKKIFNFDHKQLISERDVVEWALLWLNSANIPSGSELNAKWNDSRYWPTARDDNYAWNFNVAQRMSPNPQNRLYVPGTATDNDFATRYVGRLNPTNIKERDEVQVLSASPWGAKFHFQSGVRTTEVKFTIRNASTHMASYSSGWLQASWGPGVSEPYIAFSRQALVAGKTYYADFSWRSREHGNTAVTLLDCRTPNFVAH